MGMWAGIAAGIESSEAKKEKELAEAKLDAQFTEGNRIKLLGMALKYSDKNRRSFTGGDYKVASADGKTTKKSIPPIEQSLARLVEFEIPEATLDRVAGGSASDLNKIVESFIAAKKKHTAEYGASNPMPNEMFVEALNNAVITQPEGYKVDVDAVLEQFGITASEAERLMFGQDVEPRANINLQAESLNIVPALSFKDLDAATRAVGLGVVQTAQVELKKYQDTIGQFPSEDTEVNKWLAARVGQIQSGISNATGDIPILTDLFGLFGNSYASQYIESQPVLNNAVKMGQFPRSYAEAAARPDLDLTAPVQDVENLAEYGQKIFKYLMQNDLVPVGTTVKFYGSGGAIAEQTVTEQLIEQFNRVQ
tara:strand:+ start:511 stop:1608 length:1098 start_codon:yes stop_codon:yes gene_type:complete